METFQRIIYQALSEGLRNRFFELQSGDDRMVVWGEADDIEGFKSHVYLDRTVFIRDQSGSDSDLIERKSLPRLLIIMKTTLC